MAYSASPVVSTKITPAADAGGTSPNIDTSTGSIDLIIFTVFAASGSSPTAVDNKSNSYTLRLTRTDTAFAQVQIFTCSSPTVGTGHNFTTAGGSLNQSAVITCWSGSKLVSVVDQSASDWNGSSTTIQAGSITPTQNNELLIMAVCFGGGVGGVGTIDGGFTVNSGLQLPFSAGNYYGGMQAYLVQTSATAANPTATLSATPLRLSAGIMSFFTAATDATVSLTGVSATAAVGDLTVAATGSQPLTGVAATAAAGSFSLAVTSTKALTGVSATAAAGTLTATASATVALVGVQATAHAGDLTSVTNFLSVPMITIMNANPIPVDSEMEDDPIPGEGVMPYQIAFECVLNLNPIPMTGTLSAVPIPAEGSVP